MENSVHFNQNNFNNNLPFGEEDRLAYNGAERKRPVPQFVRASAPPGSSPRWEKLQEERRSAKKTPSMNKQSPIRSISVKSRKQVELKLNVRKNLDSHASDANMSHIMRMKEICENLKRIEDKTSEKYKQAAILFLKHFIITMNFFENRANGGVKPSEGLNQNTKSILDAFLEIKDAVIEITDPYNGYITPRILSGVSINEPQTLKQKKQIFRSPARRPEQLTQKSNYEKFRDANKSLKWLVNLIFHLNNPILPLQLAKL